MKLTIDNLGPIDYSSWLDPQAAARLLRRLNSASELSFALVAAQPEFVVPAEGARVKLARLNGSVLFTGYLASAPEYEYLGWSQAGPVYRYLLIATGDECLLDRGTLPQRSPFVGRSAGDILSQLANDALLGALDYSSVQPLDTLPSFVSDTRKTWSQHAADLGLRARASYRVLDNSFSSRSAPASTCSPNPTPGSPPTRSNFLGCPTRAGLD